jgi:hypothetical protein
MEKEIVSAVVAVGLLALGLITLEKNTRMRTKGKKTKGIIFENYRYRSAPFSVNGIKLHFGGYPTVRFLTHDNRWMTEKLNVRLSWLFYPEGKEIDILYNPQNPREIVFDNILNTILFPWFSTITGLISVVFICLELLEIINYIK